MLVEMEDGVEEREEEQVQVVVEEKGEASVHWRLAHSSGESHQSMCMRCCVLHHDRGWRRIAEWRGSLARAASQLRASVAGGK
jgi:hypothetical protein